MGTRSPQPAFFPLTAPVELAADSAADGNKERRFNALAYTGAPVRRYDGVWMVFDLSSTKVDPALPILLQHDDGRNVGFAEKTQIDKTAGIKLSGPLLANEHAQRVIADADAGFPWQMSVRIYSEKSDEIGPDESIEVNGRSLKGPGYVYRKNRVREASFVSVGADGETSAQVLSFLHQFDQDGDDTMEKDQLAARVTALETELAAEKAKTVATQTELDALKAANAEAAKWRRVDAVKSLCADIGVEFKADESVKPYADLSDESFGAIAAQLRATAKAKQPAQGAQQLASLRQEIATGGTQGGGTGATPEPAVSALLADAKRRADAAQAQQRR